MRTSNAIAKPAVLAMLTALGLQVSTTLAQTPTRIAYQGRLLDNNSPANEVIDVAFGIWDSAAGGTELAGPLTNSAVGVSNGLFTVIFDPGPGVFTGPPRWLEIGVRTNGGGAFSTLSPRQPLTATPYAIMANNASNLVGTVPASQLSGTLPSSALSGTYSGAVTLNNAGNSFSGSGAGLSSVNAATLGGLNASNFWQTGGNNVSTGQFLGSSNNQPVEIWANGQRALRLEPGAVPNVLGGFVSNSANSGVLGAYIGGGGTNGKPNLVSASYGVIGGGLGNSVSGVGGFVGGGGADGNGTFGANVASGPASAVAGGISDVASGVNAFVGGGVNNAASSYYAVVAGGANNQASSSFAAVAGGELNVGAGSFAAIPGGYQNNAGGQYSLAAGRRAKANHDGTFVWADSTDADFSSTAANQLLIRASGGVGIGTNNPSGAALNVNGTLLALNFGGSGAGLTGLNPANLSAGTAAINISGNAATANNFSGSLNGDVTGTQGATVVTPNIPRLALANTFTGTNVFGGIIATNAHNIFSIENRTNDPPSQVVGQIWLRTDL